MSRYQTQAVELVNYLAKHPDSTRQELESALHLTSTLGNIVRFVRLRAGHEVLVTKYSREKGEYTYALALDSSEALDYIKRRRRKVRNEAANLVEMINRTEAKFGTDPLLSMVRVQLQSAVNTLDLDLVGVGG